MLNRTGALLIALALTLVVAIPASADGISFSTGSPDGRMAVASRPGSSEIEAADDFILGSQTSITGATFTGLLPSGAPLSTINQVVVEIYQVFPKDSNTTRTPHVPTRANSPSDVAFASRDSGVPSLTYSTSVLSSSFSASNSVVNGIHPSPGQTTGGEGAVRGEEVKFSILFKTPFDLPKDHYFFVPQVSLSSGNFLWLSTGGPPQFTGDLQAWVRNSNLDPDWLRVGTDIVGGGSKAPKFDMSFSLAGTTVPEPATGLLLLCGLPLLTGLARRARSSDR